mmetsp:Transcript_112873/g.224647  ORF Transcript_112873/g.224647 Transcript_112873/m.224647 type:complete len:212 (+) Transcript_112873:1338-1973(+)
MLRVTSNYGKLQSLDLSTSFLQQFACRRLSTLPEVAQSTELLERYLLYKSSRDPRCIRGSQLICHPRLAGITFCPPGLAELFMPLMPCHTFLAILGKKLLELLQPVVYHTCSKVRYNSELPHVLSSFCWPRSNQQARGFLMRLPRFHGTLACTCFSCNMSTQHQHHNAAHEHTDSNAGRSCEDCSCSAQQLQAFAVSVACRLSITCYIPRL